MKEKLTTFLLSFVSGWVDTAGFIALGGILTAHVTGNFVLAGASLARSDVEGVWPKLVMFPVFVAAAGAAYSISHRLARGGRRPLPVLMLIEAFFLCAFALAGWYFQPLPAIQMTESQVILTGALGVIAMAVQNAYMKLHLGKMTMTTVMTGNVTQLAIDLVRCLSRLVNPAGEDEEAAVLDERLKKIGTAILGFLTGAGSGAVLVSGFGLLSVLPAAAIIIVIALIVEKPAAPHPN